MTATIASALHTHHTGAILRPLTGLVFGLAITASLFWIMQNLIETADRTLGEKSTPINFDIVRLERDETVNTRPHRPKNPPKPQNQPPQPPMTKLDNLNPTVTEVAISRPIVDAAPKMNNTFNVGGNGDYLPIVKVSPVYPSRALQRGIQGYCVVEYTVTKFGTTRDIAVVKDQCSSSLFHSASIAAALKFKYKPRVVDNVEIEVPGVRNRFTYEIVD